MVQKAKFEYSPLVTGFNKGLDESDKKEGLLKILKNIKDQLDAIKDQGEKQLDAIKDHYKSNYMQLRNKRKIN